MSGHVQALAVVLASGLMIAVGLVLDGRGLPPAVRLAGNRLAVAGSAGAALAWATERAWLLAVIAAGSCLVAVLRVRGRTR